MDIRDLIKEKWKKGPFSIRVDENEEITFNKGSPTYKLIQDNLKNIWDEKIIDANSGALLNTYKGNYFFFDQQGEKLFLIYLKRLRNLFLLKVNELKTDEVVTNNKR